MTGIKFTDMAAISGLRITDSGNAHAEVRCARTGCQTYRGEEMGLTDRESVTVYRPESAVFSKDSLATFAGKPVTIGHPAELVTADNWKSHAVGDVGDEIARDGEFVKVPFRLLDAAAIKAVQDGTREISMGYTTPILMQDGTAPDGTHYDAIQIGPIKINHLAIVPKARGGDELRIGDGAANWGATPCPPTSNIKDSPMTMLTVVLGDRAAQVAIADAPIVEKFKVDMAKMLADTTEASTTAIVAKDEEIGTLKADKKKLEDAAMTPDKVSKLVADRVTLETAVKCISDKIVCDGVADADLRKAAVAHKYGAELVADASEAEITGMFKALARDVGTKDKDTFANNVKDGVVHQVTDSWASFLPSQKEA